MHATSTTPTITTTHKKGISNGIISIAEEREQLGLLRPVNHDGFYPGEYQQWGREREVGEIQVMSSQNTLIIPHWATQLNTIIIKPNLKNVKR